VTMQQHYAADAEVAAAAAAASRAGQGSHQAGSFSRGCSPVPPLILPTEADLMPEPSRLGTCSPEMLSPRPGHILHFSPALTQSAAATSAYGGPAAAAAAAAGMFGSLAGSIPGASEPGSFLGWTPQEAPNGSLSIDNAEARYAELLARLQTFMPALRAAACGGIDFEGTWQVVKVRPEHPSLSSHQLPAWPGWHPSSHSCVSASFAVSGLQAADSRATSLTHARRTSAPACGCRQADTDGWVTQTGG
jgi:hypothetical protein